MDRPKSILIEKGFEIFESEITLRKGTSVIHTIVIDPTLTDITLAVNSEANGHHWADATVRGLIPYEEWMQPNFTETNNIFRSTSVLTYADKKPDANLITEANGNLFWNLGNWAFCDGTFYHHYREIFHGKQVALVHTEKEKYEVKAVDFNEERPFQSIDFALSGIPIISSGKPVGLFEQHPLTNRLLLSEFYGDLSHLLNTAMCAPLNRHLFYSLTTIEPETITLENMSPLSKKVFERDSTNTFSKYTRSKSQTVESALQGDIIHVGLEGYFTEIIEQDLERFGYTRNPPLHSRGDYYIDGKNLYVKLLRATFGHSMISTCTDGMLLLTKVYTDETRKGGYVEDMADVVLTCALQLGHPIKDTLITSNGGDLRIYTPHHTPAFLSHSSSHTHLTYRGDEPYGITSAFLLSKRGPP